MYALWREEKAYDGNAGYTFVIEKDNTIITFTPEIKNFNRDEKRKGLSVQVSCAIVAGSETIGFGHPILSRTPESVAVTSSRAK